MAEDEFVDSCAFGDAPTSVTSVCSAAIRCEGGTGGAVPLEVAEVGNLVDEDVGTLGEGDQIVVHGGVAGEHDGAVRGVETVCESRNRPAVRHRDGGDLNNSIFEDDDRNLGDALSPGRDGDVDCPDQRARVRHVASSGMTFRW